MESIKKAIELINGALEFPDTKETSGPKQFANKRNRLISYSLLSSWYITLALEAGQDGDESLKEQYVTKAEDSVHEIEQILGTGDNINMTKWNGLLELARGNKDAAIRQLYAAFEGFKAGAYSFRIENSSKTWATQYDFPAVVEGTFFKGELPAQIPSFL